MITRPVFIPSSESANMIILSLIHAKTSGDGTLLSQYVRNIILFC